MTLTPTGHQQPCPESLRSYNTPMLDIKLIRDQPDLGWQAEVLVMRRPLTWSWNTTNAAAKHWLKSRL
jgi:hypothetical protein